MVAPIDFPHRHLCPTCWGAGVREVWRAMQTCPLCGGRGFIESTSSPWTSLHIADHVDRTDPQQLADVMTVLLCEQREPAVDRDRWPAYRGVNGCRCPVGFLIPDARYSVALEKRRAFHPDVLAAVGVPMSNYTTEEHYGQERPPTHAVLKAWQTAHDRCVVLVQGNYRDMLFRELAVAYRSLNLNPAILHGVAAVWGVTP